MSGSPEKPDIDPTFPAKNPTFGRRQGCETHRASPVHHDTQNSRCSRSSGINPRPCGMGATVGEPATESTAPNANWRNMVEIIKKPKFLFVVQVV